MDRSGYSSKAVIILQFDTLTLLTLATRTVGQKCCSVGRGVNEANYQVPITVLRMFLDYIYIHYEQYSTALGE